MISMIRMTKALLLGILAGIFGVIISITPFILELEESAGLDWLFFLQGPQIPPADVVVVSIDRISADALGLPSEPGKWPRSYHAELINKLSAAGASVIVLDIYFKEPRGEQQDAPLVTAIDKASNVVIFEYTKKGITRLFDKAGNYTGETITQQLVPPVESIADSALAFAPFPLPVFPAKVSQFWVFARGTGDLPTEPVVALQVHAAAVYPELLDLVERMAPAWQRPHVNAGNAPLETIQAMRTVFRENPALAEGMLGALSDELQGRYTPEQHVLLKALIRLYAGEDSRYLNFYGPPQTVTTVPYVQVFQPDVQLPNISQPVDLHGKAVFVGYSERLQPEQLDEFYTVFSQKNGLHLSGVEIAATAFANLLEDKSIIPLGIPAYYLLLLCWGILVGALARLLPVFIAVAVTIGLAGIYIGTSHLLFVHSQTWLPQVVPLLVQVPLILFAAILWRYLEVHRERESIRTAFEFYLPPKVVEKLANDFASGTSESQLMFGTCLYTDAEQYTALSEGMEPDALGKLMNNYYESLFQPVRDNEGIISDVVGDSMLAIWPSDNPEPEARSRAIQATLGIMQSLETPKTRNSDHHLPTRIGLHTGRILLGHIGAIDHYEYRAVGDIVNTTSRIQGMNKHLGTRSLLSREVLEGVSDLVTREIGSFILSGKTQPLVLHELIGHQDSDINPDWLHMQSTFSDGLAAFRQGDWATAKRAFSRLFEEYGDTVSRYYLNLLSQWQQPGSDWDGIVRMQMK